MPQKKWNPAIPGFDQMLHGGDYNPDQWLHEPAVIAEDFRLMPKAGYNIVSLGIFAWTSLEPEEGRYTFEWLDEIMDRVARAGMKAALATPSGAKPLWMSEKYPEVRRMTPVGDGMHLLREPSGFRHNHCFTSPVYRAKVAEINGRLAARYAKHPALGLWHISNEYGGECHCDYCYEAFRAWLRRKYGTLEALNRAWWSRFWSHTITEWSQIQGTDWSVDAMKVDWRRFVSHQTTDFMRHEIAALRKHTPQVPVTTNMMNTYHRLDYAVMADHVDVIANDSYPNYGDSAQLWHQAGWISFNHDVERGLKHGQPFIQMECSPSATNWTKVTALKRPGIHRLEALAAVAHGAEGVMYFQWRKGSGGFEKNHGAVVDHVGHENTRVFRDVAEVGEILRKLQPVRGSTVRSDVALIHDWNARWSLEYTAGPGAGSAAPDRDCCDVSCSHYRSFWKQGMNVDVVRPDADFSGYRLVVAPMLHLVDAGLAAKLRAFVSNGGTLVSTFLSAVVDDNNQCYRGGLPGAGLREVFGVWAEEIDHLEDSDAQSLVMKPKNKLGLKGTFKAHTYCDLLHAEGAEVLASYGGQFYKNAPAVTRNRFGKGQAIYIGAKTDEDFLDAFYRALAAKLPIRPVISGRIPEGVMVRTRTDGENTWLFVLNFRRTPQTVTLGKGRRRDLITGKPVGERLRLPGYGSTVLALEPTRPMRARNA
jgi:beta-galactosidase